MVGPEGEGKMRIERKKSMNEIDAQAERAKLRGERVDKAKMMHID